MRAIISYSNVTRGAIFCTYPTEHEIQEYTGISIIFFAQHICMQSSRGVQ